MPWSIMTISLPNRKEARDFEWKAHCHGVRGCIIPFYFIFIFKNSSSNSQYPKQAVHAGFLFHHKYMINDFM